jgi:OmpA-like transmembrane domain
MKKSYGNKILVAALFACAASAGMTNAFADAIPGASQAESVQGFQVSTGGAPAATYTPSTSSKGSGVVGTLNGMKAKVKVQVAYNTNRNEPGELFKDTPMQLRPSLNLIGSVGITPNYAIETGYVNLAKSSGMGNAANATFKEYAIPLRVVGTYNVTDTFALNGRVGVAYMDGRLTEAGTTKKLYSLGETFGVGVKFKVTNDLSAVIDYDRYYNRSGGLLIKQAQLTAGAEYAF